MTRTLRTYVYACPVRGAFVGVVLVWNAPLWDIDVAVGSFESMEAAERAAATAMNERRATRPDYLNHTEITDKHTLECDLDEDCMCGGLS